MKKILVLEDEPPVMRIFEAVLRGYTVVGASTAAQAIFEHGRENFELLIADVRLAVSSGVLVAVELHSRTPALRTILTSGCPLNMWDEEDLAKLRELPLGAVSILQKPFVPETLLAKVYGLIGEPAASSIAAVS